MVISYGCLALGTEKRKIKQNMSRKGNCLDNTAVENFFSLLKSELFYLKGLNSILALKRDIIKYIYYYNDDRLKIEIKRLKTCTIWN